MRFLRASHPRQGIFLIDLTAMVFGMPRALFPEWGVSILGGDESTVGFLFAAPAIGALLAGLLSERVSRVTSSGRATVMAVIGWGLSIVAFGFSTTLAVAVAALALAGGCDALSSIFRQTILQITTPDRLRGRLSAVQIAVVPGGPRIGDAEQARLPRCFPPRSPPGRVAWLLPSELWSSQRSSPVLPVGGLPMLPIANAEPIAWSRAGSGERRTNDLAARATSWFGGVRK